MFHTKAVDKIKKTFCIQ